MRHIYVLGEGNCAYNAFALGLKYLADCKSLSVNDLPKEFIKIALEINQFWKTVDDIFSWLMETKDLIIIQITLAPILRLTAVSFQKQYYQSKPEDSEIVHFLGEEAQSGNKDYFKLMEEPARSSGDIQRWGSQVEIDVLAIMFKIGVQFNDGHPNPKWLGIPFGYIDPVENNNMTSVVLNSLCSRGVLTKHYSIYVLNAKSQELIKPVKYADKLITKLNQMKEQLACTVDMWLADLCLDEEEKKGLILDLIRRGAITTNFILCRETVDGKPGVPWLEEIERRINLLPQELNDYINSKYRENSKITLELKGNHWSLYVPDTYNTNVEDNALFNFDNLNNTSSKINVQHFHFQMKQKDIICLQKMKQELLKLHTPEYQKQNILLNIAILSGGEEGISFNDNYDDKSYYIRNRYGMKLRNQGNLLNKNIKTRIDFEMLFRCKALVEHGYNPNFNIISQDLKFLHDKIRFILMNEFKEDASVFINKNNDSLHTIDNLLDVDLGSISKYVNENYPELILKKIIKEAEDLSRLDSINRESVYFFSRKLVILGELYHDYSEVFPERKNQKILNLFSLFSRLNGYRNRFVHFDLHQTIIRRLKERDNEELSKCMQMFAKNFVTLVKNAKSLDAEFDQKQVEFYKVVTESLGKISELLSPSKKASLRKKIMENLVKVDQLFVIYNSEKYKTFIKCLNNILSKIKDKKLHDELERGIKDYNVTYLIGLINKNIDNIPDITKDDITQLKNLITALTCIILELQANDLKREIQDILDDHDITEVMVEIFGSKFLPDFDINTLKYNDVDTNKALENWLSILKKNVNISLAIKSPGKSKLNNPHYRLYDYLNDVKQKIGSNKMYGGSITNIQKDFNKYIEEVRSLVSSIDKEELLQEFGFSISTDINIQQKIKCLVGKSTQKSFHKDQLNVYSNKIHKEISYLEQIECTNHDFKNAIFEHVVTLLGQYMRDIEVITIHGKLLLSNTSRIAGQTAKSLRSKGLVHEIFNFDSKRFEQKLLRHITPSAKDFAAIATIYSQGGAVEIAKTSLLFAEMGDAFKRLGHYKQATDYYYNGLQTFLLEKPLDEYNENSLQNKPVLKKMSITQPTAVLLDHSEVIFGISIFELQLYAKLQEGFYKINDTEGGKRVLKLCLSRINFNDILKYKKLLIEFENVNDKDKKDGNNLSFSLTDKSKEKFFMKHKQYFDKVCEVIKKITSIKRPYVLLDTAQALFESIADIFHQNARVLIKQKEYKEALKYLLRSIELTTGDVKHIEVADRSLFHIPTYDYEKMLSCYVDISLCYYKLGNNDLAQLRCKQAMSAQDLIIRLKSHALNYFMCRDALSYGSDKLSILANQFFSEFDNKLNHIKKISGDDSLEILEWYYKLKIDYIFTIKNLPASLPICVEGIEKDLVTDFGLSIEQAFPDLYWYILKTLYNSLSVSLSKNVFKMILNIFEQYLLKVIQLGIDDKKIDKYKKLFTAKINEFLDHYIATSIQGLTEVSELLMSSEVNAYYTTCIVQYILRVRDNYLNNSIDLFKLGQRFSICAKIHYEKKNYERAEPLFKIAVELLAFGNESFELVFCWHQIGGMCMERKQYFRAIVAYQEVIRTAKGLPHLNFTSLNSYGKSREAVEKFSKFLLQQHDISAKQFKQNNFIQSIHTASDALKELEQYIKYLKQQGQSLNDSYKEIKGYLHYILGMSYFSSQSIDLAKIEFDSCIEILLSCHVLNKDKITKARMHQEQCVKKLGLFVAQQKSISP